MIVPFIPILPEMNYENVTDVNHFENGEKKKKD